MGWYYTWNATRKDIIAELTASSNRRQVIRHCTSGNVLWTVEVIHQPIVPEGPEGPPEPLDTFIGCYLLTRGTGDGWGYKPMDEGMGPCYYTCPKAYLAIAPVLCAEWRETVNVYHEQRKQARLRARAVSNL